MLSNTVLQPNKKPSKSPECDVAVLQSRIDRMSDHRMRWCVHRAFRRWSFSSRTRTRLDSNSRVDDGFFFVFSVWTRRPRPTFPLFKLALRPGSTPDSSRHRSSISLPRNHVAFSFTKQVRFEHSIRSPSPSSMTPFGRACVVSKCIQGNFETAPTRQHHCNPP